MTDLNEATTLDRRRLLKFSLQLGGATAVSSTLQGKDALAQVCGGGQSAIEVYPTSPLILKPFTDALPIPAPMKPTSPTIWPVAPTLQTGGCQDSDRIGVHQCGYNDPMLGTPKLPTIYGIDVKVGAHSFTSSPVLPIDSNGLKVALPPGAPVTQAVDGTVAKLPDSTIYGFADASNPNSLPTFPGPMIYASYGQPVSVRFRNRLTENPLNMDRQNFGDTTFLTHLHNGHTAPESDGNPHYREQAYNTAQWCDNLYLNYPAGGDDREKQSFLWFHDHREGHTGANVYKGMVGLYPIYDPGKDDGDETKGFRLPGVKNALTGRIDYDIPLGFYDCCLDDGRTQHQDFHNGCGETHPEWWGKTFFRHFPNHGFVGDVFTVNGKAYPVIRVKRRRYRLRFLDCSIARCYNLSLVRSLGGPKAARDLGRKGPQMQGQYMLPDAQQCMKMVQIASEGGLLPYPLLRNSIEIWPAKRREVIVDFSKYMDGSPTCSAGKEEVIYLMNDLPMTDGRMPLPGSDPGFKVPMIKIIIEPGTVADNSFDPMDYKTKDPVDGFCSLLLNRTTRLPMLKLRDAPPLPASFAGLIQRRFELQRSGTFGGETQWVINSLPFTPSAPLADPAMGTAEVWTIRNGGGGWTHPMHLHMEEHLVVSRNGVLTPKATDPTLYNRTHSGHSHADDIGKEDVLNLDPGEELVIYRKFRDFKGPYVAHCHNLAHEDHAMMFAWKIK